MADLRAAIRAEVARELGQAPRAPTSGDRAVVTCQGRNRPGVIARIATVIDQFHGDIRELNQTIVGDYYALILIVDLSRTLAQGVVLDTLRHALSQAAQELQAQLVVMHEDILVSMHDV